MGRVVRLIIYLGFISNFVLSQCLISNNLVTNSDFNLGFSGFTSDYQINPGNLVPEGKFDVVNNPNSTHGAFAACGDNTGGGNMMVVNGSGVADEKIWCQTVAVDQTSEYSFSTHITSVHPASPAIIQFSINGIELGTPFVAPSAPCSWSQFCETWDSNLNTSAEICIVNKNTAATGNDFAIDDIQMGKVVGALPVTLGSFIAENENADVKLTWVAYAEVNHDRYIIESSLDAMEWKVLGYSAGRMLYEDSVEYVFYDHLPAEGINYYRLKMISNDGEIEYSDVRMINHEFFSKIVEAYPNPMVDRISLRMNEQVSDVTVLDQMGKTIYFQKQPSRNQNISLPNLKSGAYYLRFKTVRGDFQKKVIIKQ